MTSQINPNNIDGTYPVAGQDNNSQGFRDNFTNIKVNFQFAEDEINDLQSKAVLKSALTGSTLDNNMNDNLIYAAKIQDFSATKATINDTSGTISIIYAAGHYQTIAPTGPVSLSFFTGPNGWPANGSYGWVQIEITITNTAYTVTLPNSVQYGINNLQGYEDGTITFNRTGKFVFEFSTYDGGNTVTVRDLTRNLDPIFLPSSQDLSNGEPVSLTTTATYFTTTAGWTSTMGAGINGQIKTLMMVGNGGNMVITVANPGWGGSGTITFNSVGQACTLQYIANKWFCVGSNSVGYHATNNPTGGPIFA